MLLRFAVFGLLALGLGGFGTVAWLATRPPPAPPAVEVAVAPEPAPLPPPPPAHHIVLAAAGAIRAGTLLKPEDLVAQDVPAVPVGAQGDTPAIRASLFGGMVRRSLAAGEAVLAADVMRPGDHGFLAAVLGPNMRAASVAVDAVSGSAGLIWPGDRVDLILTQTLEDTTLPAGRRVAAETVLADVRVIAIDQLLARGVAPAADPAGTSATRTVTFEVTPMQAERVAVATRLGRLSLAVRSAESVAATEAGAPIKTMWGGDVSPALGNPVAAASSSLRLFQGSADSKEFHF